MANKKEKNKAAVELGRRGGLKGGKSRANLLTPEQRSEIARLAAEKRWYGDRVKNGLLKYHGDYLSDECIALIGEEIERCGFAKIRADIEAFLEIYSDFIENGKTKD